MRKVGLSDYFFKKEGMNVLCLTELQRRAFCCCFYWFLLPRVLIASPSLCHALQMIHAFIDYRLLVRSDHCPGKTVPTAF